MAAALAVELAVRGSISTACDSHKVIKTKVAPKTNHSQCYLHHLHLVWKLTGLSARLGNTTLASGMLTGSLLGCTVLSGMLTGRLVMVSPWLL